MEKERKKGGQKEKGKKKGGQKRGQKSLFFVGGDSPFSQPLIKRY
jgi:hypothetical protein